MMAWGEEAKSRMRRKTRGRGIVFLLSFRISRKFASLNQCVNGLFLLDGAPDFSLNAGNQPSLIFCRKSTR
jgi:hypothetical protein